MADPLTPVHRSSSQARQTSGTPQEVLADRIARIWGSRPPTQTLTGVAALALPAMLFEVDAIAVRRY